MGVRGIGEEIEYGDKLNNCRKKAVNQNPTTITPREEVITINELIIADFQLSLCYVEDDEGRTWEIPFTRSERGIDGKVQFCELEPGLRLKLQITSSEKIIDTIVVKCEP